MSDRAIQRSRSLRKYRPSDIAVGSKVSRNCVNMPLVYLLQLELKNLDPKLVHVPLGCSA